MLDKAPNAGFFAIKKIFCCGVPPCILHWGEILIPNPMLATLEKTVTNIGNGNVDYVLIASITLFTLIVIGLAFLIMRE